VKTAVVPSEGEESFFTFCGGAALAVPKKPFTQLTLPLDNSRYDDYSKCVSTAKPQKRSYQSPETRVFVALLIAADRLSQQAEQLVKEHSLTGTQYNVLRILRGAEPAGLPCKGISDRMISHDPDMTRLLDRLEKRGVISRERQADDRRVVKARITAAGLDILKKLDAPVLELHRKQFHSLGAPRLKNLTTALEEIIPETPDNT
jgi:DNA-binding MarR family transcriptional regulator